MTRRELISSTAVVLAGACVAKPAAPPVLARRAAVAVIGAGPFGAWTARRFAEAGWRVQLLDAYGPGNARASSGGETRFLRLAYGDAELYTDMSQASLAAWKGLAQRSGQPLFIETGELFMAAERSAYIEASAAALARRGLPHEPLTQAEIARRYPQMGTGDVAHGLFSPHAGVLMARRGVQAAAEDARALGAELAIAAVAPPKREGGRFAVRLLDGAPVLAERYVFACGPWLPKLFPELLGPLIKPTRQEAFFFGTPAGEARYRPGALPGWAHFGPETLTYGFPEIDGRGIKICDDAPGRVVDPDSQERLVSAESLAKIRLHLAARLPALADAPLLETRVCQYEPTSTGDFLIDQHPDDDRVWLVGGGSGHGFKHGPAVGEHVFARVTGARAAEPRFTLAAKTAQAERAVH